jgi:hypothetical protein
METFAEPRELVEDPGYPDQRLDALAELSDDMLDDPIVDIVHGFNTLPHCFTLQSCYGHFLYEGQGDERNLEPLPIFAVPGEIEYRIAYICFCIENSEAGRGLLESLRRIPDIDPENVQLCSAEWFWERQVNTYALQVEPDRFKRQDKAFVDYTEALHLETLRNRFFIELGEIARMGKE